MKVTINKSRIIEIIEEMEKLSIHLNPKNKGKFTEYCKRNGFQGVTCECIKKGLAAGGQLAKEANFARNFGHKECKD